MTKPSMKDERPPAELVALAAWVNVSSPENLPKKMRAPSDPYTMAAWKRVSEALIQYQNKTLARPRVKPLVWGKAERNGMTEQADCPFGRYYVCNRGEYGWLWFMPGRLPHAGRVADCHEAKAAAQADCERRILEALEPIPDDARAALEAMLAEVQREERARALDEVSEQWAAALYGMTENGVAALNEKAASELHPEITAFSEWLSNAAIRAEAGD